MELPKRQTMKNQFILLFVLLFPVLLGFYSCKTKAVATENFTWFVQDGLPVDVVDESGAWEVSDGGFTATGDMSRLNAGHCLGSGDFELFAELRIDDVAKNNASLMLDAAGPTETGELIFARNGQITVRGFFFGDRTQRVRPIDKLIRSGEWFELKVCRKDDVVTFQIADSVVWTMKFTTNRPFGKLTLKPGQAQLSIRNFGVQGATTPLDEWVPRLERNYAIAGDNPVDVFVRGLDGYHTFRIPAMVRTNAGTLLAFAEGRKNSAGDHGNVDLVLRRSEDGGRSWLPLQLVYEEGGNAKITIGNPVPVVDQKTGSIWLFFCRDNENVLLTKSDDDGKSWTPPIDMTESLKKEDWGSWYATGPCHGIQLASGRLVVPANHGRPQGKSTQPHMIISDDHGVSWRIGGMPDTRANENTIAEIEENHLYVNMRSSDHSNRKPYCREVAWSSDGGENFGPVEHDCNLPDSICQGSLLSFQRKDGSRQLVFSNPGSQRRERLRLRSSKDGGKTWSDGLLIYEGSSSYSDLVQMDDETIGVLFERDLYNAITMVTCNIKTL